MVDIARLTSTQGAFWDELRQRLAWDDGATSRVASAVDDILEGVRGRGDEALLEYSARFDDLVVERVADLAVPAERLAEAHRGLGEESRRALDAAADRIRRYHEHQRDESWSYTEANGTRLGQQVTPLERAGIYVPGGRAAYPSSVLMNAIPARVAGVDELVMVAPAPGGELSEWVLAAAHSAGIDRFYRLGGAHAVGALAFGTETVPAVDKIVGPGNAYVAEAKRRVFGRVGIDMVAGPSEILIICDGETDPRWVAMDMFAQAEHDEDARAMLVCPDADYLARVESAMDELLPELERAEIVRESLARRGALINVRDLNEAVEVANYVAPEHLELSMTEPQATAGAIRHAGAIFMGRYAAEVLGDYCAGPNHVLPTSRTARFASPLGVYDFQKRTSIVDCSEAGGAELGRIAEVMALGEGLTAHARSAGHRVRGQDDAND
jgi:histidinol dehydrogenase